MYLLFTDKASTFLKRPQLKTSMTCTMTAIKGETTHKSILFAIFKNKLHLLQRPLRLLVSLLLLLVAVGAPKFDEKNERGQNLTGYENCENIFKMPQAES